MVKVVELFDLPVDLAGQVEGNKVLYLGSQQHFTTRGSAELSTNRWAPDQAPVRIPVEIIEGPSISEYNYSVLISPELSEQLGDDIFQVNTLHGFSEPISRATELQLIDRANELWIERFGEFGSQRDDLVLQDWVLRRTQLTVHDSFGSGVEGAYFRWGSLAIAGLLAVIIALITASLAAVELDGELQSMIATGAAPRIRRLMLGAQTLYHLLLAALLGIPLALLLFHAVVRADANAPGRFVVPWGSVALSAVVIPVVVAAIVTAMFRNGRPAVSRRLS